MSEVCTCRCDDLRATFGAGAPARCGQCELASRRAGLVKAGFVPAPTGHYQAYIDCGLQPVTLADHTMWVPCWASIVVDGLFGTPLCGPVLTRAAVDTEFRDAVLDVLSAAKDDFMVKVQAIAESQGVLARPVLI